MVKLININITVMHLQARIHIKQIVAIGVYCTAVVNIPEMVIVIQT